jgi:phage shock protein C
MWKARAGARSNSTPHKVGLSRHWQGVMTVSRSDREQRDAESAARRAHRLAERAELRAQRRAQSAQEAAERADRLAARAALGREPRGRKLDRSIEDYVDKIAESLTRKATDWLDDETDWLDDEDAASRHDQNDRESPRRARRDTRRHRPSLLSRFSSSKTLYRDKARGKVLGVCAGMADYLEVEIWHVRLFALLGLLFVGSVTLPVYFILYFLMEDKPYYRQVTDRFDDEAEGRGDYRDAAEAPRHSASERHSNHSNRSNRSNRSNGQILRSAKSKFADLEARVRSMESHVTSSRFELQREIRKIAGDEL